MATTIRSSSSCLHGLIALITGSSSGIGRGIVLAFASEGARLVVCADLHLEPPSSSPPAAAANEGQGEGDDQRPTHEVICVTHGKGRAVFMRCDVSIERAGESGVEVVVEEGRGGEKVLGIADVVAYAVRIAGRLDM